MTAHDAIIVGGGPAGSSAAITLAGRGLRVLLLEEKRMPRAKLCGEFITPESFSTLERLGVLPAMMAAGAQRLTRLALVVASGKRVETPLAKMSAVADWAMSLSRARFDQILFERAREAGADCREGIAVKQCVIEEGRARGVEALSLADGKTARYDAPLILDASGRQSRLMVNRDERRAGRRGSRLYGLKAHLNHVEGINEQVELYFFPQGYGGLSRVEDGLVNLCFIAGEQTFRAAGGDPQRIIEATIMRNKLARERLGNAQVVGKWHSVGPLTFGHRRLSQSGVLAVGDAAGMIDPFTGTGIQMALRTGELAAQAILQAVGEDATGSAGLFERVFSHYANGYANEFGTRLRVAGWLRRVALSPTIVGPMATLLSLSPRLTRRVLLATRD